MMFRLRSRVAIPASVVRSSVLFVLVIALVGVGLVVTRVPPVLVPLAVVAPLVAFLALRRLEYRVLALVVTAAFVRVSLPTGTNSRIVASLLMTAVLIMIWIIEMLVRDKKLHLTPSSTNVPLLAFILTAVISYVWSNAFRDPLVIVWHTWPFVQLGGLAVMVLLPGAFLLVVNSISEVRSLRWLYWLMVCIGVLSLVDHVLPISLPFLNTGGLFSLWFVSLTYAQALFNKRLPLWLRLILLGVAGVWMYIYFVTWVTWLSGWLPPLAAIGTVSLLRSKKLFLIFVLLMLVYVGLNLDYYIGTVLERETAESGLSRLDAWAHNWQVTSKHLLFGTGPAGYAAYYMSYFPTDAMATHSNYIDVLSQTGIVGLFFCLWFFGSLGWTGYKACMRLTGSGDFSEGFAVATLGGWAGCVVAMALGDWLFPFVYTQTIAGFDYAVYSWVLLGGMVALANIHATGKAVPV